MLGHTALSKLNSNISLLNLWQHHNKHTKIHIFYGKIGAGKTTTIRIIIQSIDTNIIVTSPTYGLCNMYYTQVGQIAHIDTYKVGILDSNLLKYIEEIYDSCIYILIETTTEISSYIMPAILWTISYKGSALRLINTHTLPLYEA